MLFPGNALKRKFFLISQTNKTLITCFQFQLPPDLPQQHTPPHHFQTHNSNPLRSETLELLPIQPHAPRVAVSGTRPLHNPCGTGTAARTLQSTASAAPKVSPQRSGKALRSQSPRTQCSTACPAPPRGSSRPNRSAAPPAAGPPPPGPVRKAREASCHARWRAGGTEPRRAEAVVVGAAGSGGSLGEFPSGRGVVTWRRWRRKSVVAGLGVPFLAILFCFWGCDWKRVLCWL